MSLQRSLLPCVKHVLLHELNQLSLVAGEKHRTHESGDSELLDYLEYINLIVQLAYA